MTDKEAHEAVMNKTWYKKVSEHDAPRLQLRGWVRHVRFL